MDEKSVEKIALRIASPRWSKDGYDIDFKGADLDEPPHIHISKDKHKAKYWLLSNKFAYLGGFGFGDLRKIKKIIKSLYNEIIGAWNDLIKRRDSNNR